jgi:hypothetical protein
LIYCRNFFKLKFCISKGSRWVNYCIIRFSRFNSPPIVKIESEPKQWKARTNCTKHKNPWQLSLTFLPYLSLSLDFVMNGKRKRTNSNRFHDCCCCCSMRLDIMVQSYKTSVRKPWWNSSCVWKIVGSNL